MSKFTEEEEKKIRRNEYMKKYNQRPRVKERVKEYKKEYHKEYMQRPEVKIKNEFSEQKRIEKLQETKKRIKFIKNRREQYKSQPWASIANEIGITRQALYLFVKKHMKKTGE